MTFIKSLACTFLMYSRIPMPQVEWNEDNRRYSLALFPLVGAIIGALLVVWTLICNLLDIGKWLYAAVCCLIPIAVTGGIHADGFSDVTDAKSSYAPREKKARNNERPACRLIRSYFHCTVFYPPIWLVYRD